MLRRAVVLVGLVVIVAIAIHPNRAQAHETLRAVTTQASGAAATPEEAFEAFVREELTARRFVGPCSQAQVGRDAGAYCRSFVEERRGLHLFGVGIFQADGDLLVFVAQVGEGWMVVGTAGLGVVNNGVPWPWPDDEPLTASEALTQLASDVPGDAGRFSLEMFRLAGAVYTHVRYEREEEIAPVFPPNSRIPMQRRYDRLHRWDGEQWVVAVDAYALALDVYGADVLGPLDGGAPTEATALVELDTIPLARGADDQGGMPDLIAFQLRFREGPTGLPHPSPTVVVMTPSDEGLALLYQTAFDVRGRLRYVFRMLGEVYIGAPAYVGPGGQCCPMGTEVVRLAWRGGRLVEAQRCRRPGERVYNC